VVLILEVTGRAAAELGANSRRELRSCSGTIGRLPDNTLVLADQHVSGCHALIHFEDGSYYVEDNRSTNGVALDSPDNRLEPGRRHPLASGSRIFIEPFEISVRIEPAQFDAVPHGPQPVVAVSGDEVVDPLELIGGAGRQKPKTSPRGEDLAMGSPLRENIRAPVPAGSPPPPGAARIPTGYNPLAEHAPRPYTDPGRGKVPDPEPQLNAPPARATPSLPAEPRPDAQMGRLLDALGLDPAAASPELVDELGEVLRLVIEGTMELLRARQQIKEEFRLPFTSYRPAENNPLKFSANVEEALQKLFGRRNAAYLGPVEAFDDAFEDLRHHQIAVLAGVRRAFELILADFNPDRLQEQFDRQMREGALLAKPASLRYWNLYRDWIRDKVADADTGFRELFGDRFAEAYEEQLRRLRTQGRSGR
jgi:type VI secretion system FHA domain protein